MANVKSAPLDIGDEPDATAARALSKAVRRLVPLLFIVFSIAYLDRANIGMAQFQMRAALGFNNTAYGFAAGIFFAGYFLFEVPCNLVLVKVGARSCFTAIVLVWGAATLAITFVKQIDALYGLRFLVGAAEAGFLPGIMFYFCQWFPNRARARINALFFLSIPFSFVVGSPLSGWLLSRLDGLAGVMGWQWLFLIEGAVTLLFAPLLYFGLSNSPATAAWLSPSEKAAILAGLRDGLVDDAKSSANGALTKQTVLLACGYLCLLFGYYGIIFWMPIIIRNTNITDVQTIGSLSALPYLAAGLTMPVLSHWSDTRGHRAAVMIVAILSGAVGLCVTCLLWRSTVGALAGLTLATVGLFGTIPVWWALLASRYSGTSAAIAFAIINSVGALAGFSTPYFIGLVTDVTGSPIAAIYTVAAITALGAVPLLAFLDLPKLAPQRA